MIPQPDFLVRVSCMTYNHAPYIVDALNGFTMQETTFPFVCTVIDDASTDGEQEVIKAYLQEHFDLEDKSVARNEETDDYVLTFARHKTNQNCYFAVLYLKYNHYSLKKSKQPYIQEWSNTKYVALCEGDDYWIDQKKLQMQVDIMNNNPGITMCWHDAHKMSALTKEYKGGFQRYNKDTICPTDDIILGGGDFCPTASLLYRKVIRDKAPEYLFSQYVGDYPLQIYMALSGKVYYINKKMSIYRVNVPGSWVSHSYDYSNIEKRKDTWPKEIKIYNDFNAFSGYKYNHAFKQREYKYMFYEMLRLGEYGLARKYWYKIDINKRLWNWKLVMYLHGIYILKKVFK